MTETNGRPPEAQLPMFYQRPEAMNPTRHGALSLVTKPSFAFAANSHAIPIVANEMPMAMRSYPIVFVGTQKMPVAVTGLRRDENLFVGADGRWAEPHYVPAYVRRYPFILAGEEEAGRLTLCIDRASERVIDPSTTTLPNGAQHVERLFDGAEPSDVTKTALAFCQQFQQSFVATRNMIEQIDRFGLFAERRSTVTLEGGEVLNLTDFQAIDEAALAKLGDPEFLELRKSGALALIYCHLASTNSWTSVVHQAGLRKTVA